MENYKKENYDPDDRNSQNQNSQNPQTGGNDRNSYENLSTSAGEKSNSGAVASGTNPDRYTKDNTDLENKDRNAGFGRSAEDRNAGLGDTSYNAAGRDEDDTHDNENIDADTATR